MTRSCANRPLIHSSVFGHISNSTFVWDVRRNAWFFQQRTTFSFCLDKNRRNVEMWKQPWKSNTTRQSSNRFAMDFDATESQCGQHKIWIVIYSTRKQNLDHSKWLDNSTNEFGASSDYLKNIFICCDSSHSDIWCAIFRTIIDLYINTL